MDFKKSNKKPQLISRTDSILINEDDISNMLKNTYLHDSQSHYIIESNGFYNDSKLFNYGMAVDRIEILEKSFKEGKTLIVKDIEFWNQEIISFSKSLSPMTNAHLYFSPKNGTALDWHQDDRDVYVVMQYGEKVFEVEMEEDQIGSFSLKKGDVFFIPLGFRHRARTGSSESVHIGFGVWPEGLTIREAYSNLEMPLHLDNLLS